MESIAQLRKMLERFYRGETTLEEEKQLHEYFASTKVPEEFIPDKELFRTFQSGDDAVSVPGDLDQKIIASIDQAERRAVRTRRISVFSLSGLAAGLLILIAVYLFFIRQDDSHSFLAANEWSDTYEDPVEAYEEARNAMMYVSEKLNDGTEELRHIRQVQKSAEPLQQLSKINKGTKELSLLGQLQRVREIDRQ
ncbi:MAG TPA: hypothetical protein ENO20_10320 [Bacteroides sp.]|nr:hypothetical protein [Bacteroides sp.]